MRDDKQTAEAGSFSTEGKFPKVEHNVQLIQVPFWSDADNAALIPCNATAQRNSLLLEYQNT